MDYIGSMHTNTLNFCGEYATIIIDDLGNEYRRFNHELGSESNSLAMGNEAILSVVLRPGIMVKGKLVIWGVDPNARSFQLINIGFDSRIQDNSLGTICRNYGVRNLQIQ